MENSKKVQEDCLVQRLIIIHLGLVPAAGFDEDASIEELCEQILYYNEFETPLPPDTRCRYNYEEAIKFAGLCDAFYSIQSTIDNQLKNEDDHVMYSSLTKEVYLSTCTLVFIPLELSEVKGIVAIAQLPRRQISKDKSRIKVAEDHHLTPHQFAHKLAKGHELFKFMNGGIHRRLCNSSIRGESQIETHNEGPEMNQFYHDMHKLYDILKKLRILRLQLQSCSSANEYTDSFENIKTLEGELMNVTKSLPIDALRIDMRQFYDSFLRDIAVSEC